MMSLLATEKWCDQWRLWKHVSHGRMRQICDRYSRSISMYISLLATMGREKERYIFHSDVCWRVQREENQFNLTDLSFWRIWIIAEVIPFVMCAHYFREEKQSKTEEQRGERETNNREANQKVETEEVRRTKKKEERKKNTEKKKRITDRRYKNGGLQRSNHKRRSIHHTHPFPL